MKRKNISLLLCSIMLFSCNNNIVPQKEGLYTKLTRAIGNLNNSFTVTGEVCSYISNGATGIEENYFLTVEYSKDAYFCQETDMISNEPRIQESFYRGKDGESKDYAVQEYLDLSTNTIKTQTLTYKYDEFIDNSFSDLVVKDLDAIKGEPNWYEIKTTDISYDITKFITAYDVSIDGLRVSQFAMHFDGDEFDQFSILLDCDDESGAYEQYLFKLQISKVGQTTPQKIQTYEHTDDHDILKDAIDQLATAKNFTIDVDVKYSNNKLTNKNFKYFIDLENKMLLSNEVLSYTKIDYESEEDTKVYYLKGYKNIVENHDEKPWMYYFNPENGEIIKSYDYNKYQGTNPGYYRFIEYLLPRVGTMAAECFTSLGGLNFSTYGNTYLNCLLSLIPYDLKFDYNLDSSAFTLSVNRDGYINKMVLNDTYNFYVDDSYSQYESTNRTVTISYSEIGTTTMPDYLVNAK